MQILHFVLESVVELSSVRLLMPPDLRAAERRAAVAESMKEAFRRYVELHHPVLYVSVVVY